MILEDVRLERFKDKVPQGASNIIYDENRRHYVLGDRYGTRSLGNVKQIKKIGQMLYTANFCKDLVARQKTATSGSSTTSQRMGSGLRRPAGVKHSR